MGVFFAGELVVLGFFSSWTLFSAPSCVPVISGDPPDTPRSTMGWDSTASSRRGSKGPSKGMV